jgi:endonuclease/exonuclease/phosphatase family metal-dependent hydrolase
MQVDIYVEYMPDIIGLQEFAPQMREVMVPVLKAMGYEEVPVPSQNKFHNSERNTRTPVFYRADTVELLEVGYCCLGDMDYSKYPELLGKYTAKEIREVAASDRSKAVTYGIFRLKATDHVFVAGSTHLWWQDGNVHDTARIIQMQELRNVMTASADAFAVANGITAEIPVFVGGDFNTRSVRNSYYAMDDANPFIHLNTLLPTKDQLVNSSMHSYPYYNAVTGLWEKAGNANGKYNSALDHIYVNEAALDHATVVRMGMAEEYFAYATSDHAPIYSDVELHDTAAKLPTP